MNKLTALIEAAKVATPGPWRYQKHDNFIESESVKSRISDYPVTRSTDVGTEQRNKNAEFIALANPATILELCTLLEKAEKALEKERVSHITTGHTLGAKCQELYLLLMQAQTALEIINRTISCNYAGVPEALAAIKQWKEKE